MGLGEIGRRGGRGEESRLCSRVRYLGEAVLATPFLDESTVVKKVGVRSEFGSIDLVVKIQCECEVAKTKTIFGKQAGDISPSSEDKFDRSRLSECRGFSTKPAIVARWRIAIDIQSDNNGPNAVTRRLQELGLTW